MIKQFISQNVAVGGSLEVGIHFLGPNYITAELTNSTVESNTQLLFGVSFSKPLTPDANGTFFSIVFPIHVLYDNTQTVKQFNITKVDNTYKELTGNNQYFIIPVNFLAINRIRGLEIASNYDISLDVKDARYKNIILPTKLTIGDYIAVTSKLALNAKYSGLTWMGTYKFGLTNSVSIDAIMTPATMPVLAGVMGAMLYNIKTEFVKTADVKKDTTYPAFNLVCGNTTPTVPTGVKLFVNYTLNTYKYTPAVSKPTIASNDSLTVVVPTVANNTGRHITKDKITDTPGSFIIMNLTAEFKKL